MTSVFKARPLQFEFECLQVGGPVSGCNSGSWRLNALQMFDVDLLRGVPEATAIVQIWEDYGTVQTGQALPSALAKDAVQEAQKVFGF